MFLSVCFKVAFGGRWLVEEVSVSEYLERRVCFICLGRVALVMFSWQGWFGFIHLAKYWVPRRFECSWIGGFVFLGEGG